MSETILGLHQNEWSNDHVDDYIRSKKPTADLILDPSDGEVAAIKGASPLTDVLTRMYERDADVHNEYLNGDPNAAGRRWANKIFGSANRMGKFSIIVNEPPCDPASLRRQATAEVAYMKALDADGRGLKAGIGAFSTGNLQLPSIDGGASIRACEEAFRYAAAHGHALFIHLYFAAPIKNGSMIVTTPSGWVYNPRYYALRWREIFAWMRANGIPIPDTYVTEFGLDLGFCFEHGYTGAEVGYKAPAPWGYGDTEEGARRYIADCIAYAVEIAKDPEIKGILIYCAGDNGTHKWRSFMVDGYALRYLATQNLPQVAQPQQPPAPPPTPPLAVDLPVPYVSQRGEGANGSANDCGAATVKSTVLINRAVAPTVDLLAREAAGVEGQPYPNYNGLQMTTLIELGRRYGSTLARGKPPTWVLAFDVVVSALKNKKPIIALVHYDSLPVANRLIKENGKVKGHYIVLTGATDSNVTYHDPYHDGAKGKGLKLTWAQLRKAWEDNPADNNPKYDMLIMQNPQWDAPPAPPQAAWTKQDAVKAVWFSEQMARALRGDTGAMNALIGAIQAEPKRQSLHDVLVQVALPPLQRERDKAA